MSADIAANEIEKLQNELAYRKLVAWLLEQNDALREDKARLDWFLKLEEDDRVKFCRGWYRWTPETVKAEIDAARKEAQP